MKKPIDFYDPGASDDEIVRIPQGHLKNWHDLIEELMECIRITKKDIELSARELARDLKLFETR